MTSEEADDLRITRSSEQKSAGEPLRCCNSGCTACVLDYPELFLTPLKDLTLETCEPSEMLSAIELAQVLLERLETNPIDLKTEGGQ